MLPEESGRWGTAVDNMLIAKRWNHNRAIDGGQTVVWQHDQLVFHFVLIYTSVFHLVWWTQESMEL